MRKKFIDIKKAIDEAGKILLVGHEGPDGDSLGSMLALKISFENNNKIADVFCSAVVPEGLRFLPESASIKKSIGNNYDLVFGVDYGDLKRLDTVVAGLGVSLPNITIDHHLLANQTGEILVVDASFSSAAEIIYHFFEANGIAIDKRIATCLLTGIFTDTWSFRHPNATSGTLNVAADLILKGALVNKVAKLATHNNISARSRIWGRALSNINLADGGFAFCFLNEKDMVQCHASPADLSGLASLLCMIPNATFSLVLSESEAGQLDGSLRALPEKGIDVSYFAREFGGGGHKLSAGFKTAGRSEDIIKRVKQLISRGGFGNV